jgi:pimeloyl-ACP methyl ester carboxylesterase
VPALARTHRTIAVDWFGWGESERSLAVPLGYDDEVARLRALLDALGLECANVVAHDYGAFLALGFAVGHPECIRRLALLNSRAHLTFPPIYFAQFGLLSWLGRAPAVFASLPLHAAHRLLLRPYVTNGSWSLEDRDRYLGFLRTRDGRRWLGHFYRHYRVAIRRELADGCGRITAPVAIVWGDRDPYCPMTIAEDLAARLPRARLTRIAGADHYLMEERPSDVANVLQDLLREWDTSGGVDSRPLD